MEPWNPSLFFPPEYWLAYSWGVDGESPINQGVNLDLQFRLIDPRIMPDLLKYRAETAAIIERMMQP